jgi:hypothetical protein
MAASTSGQTGHTSRVATIRRGARDADDAGANRDDGASLKIRRVARKEIAEDLDAPVRGHVGKANETPVRAFVRENQDAEVGIDRNQDPVVIDRPLQDCNISRVVTELGGLDGVVPLIPQPTRKARASAAVDEESHPSADFDGV